MSARPAVRWVTQHLCDVPRHNNWLTPGERDVLESKMILKRRADWRLGRWTAKRALLAAGGPFASVTNLTEVEIRAAEDGAPEAFIHGERVPIVLSLSHSHGVALCVVAGADAQIGCDAEFVEARSEAFLADYFTASERDRIRRATAAMQPMITTILWSAKESVLKAKREGLRLDPRDVEIEFSDDELSDGWATFVAHYAGTAETFDGWWCEMDAHIYTVAERNRV